MTEMMVAITYFVLTLECLYFGVRLKGDWNRAGFFFATALSALLGGLYHGFFPGARWLWILTLVAIGVVALFLWRVALSFYRDKWWHMYANHYVWVQWAVYTSCVIDWFHEFYVAILDYLPALLFLLVTFVRFKRRKGVAGLVLSLVAAGVQQAKIGVHAVYFDHNSLYHLIQAIGFWIVYLELKK